MASSPVKIASSRKAEVRWMLITFGSCFIGSPGPSCRLPPLCCGVPRFSFARSHPGRTFWFSSRTTLRLLRLRGNLRFRLPAQPVDATPSSALIRHCLRGRTIMFGCTRSIPSQSSVPAGLTLASDSGFCFQCQAGSNLVLHRPIEITAVIGEVKFHSTWTVRRRFSRGS